MIYKKRKKNGFYVELMLIVHQQWFIGKTVVWFIGKTVVDSDITTTLQPWNHLLDPINWGSAFRSEITWQNFISLALNLRRTAKEVTAALVAAAGTPLPPPPPLCWDVFDARSTYALHLYVLSGAVVDL
jgi:hypothetical protein